MVDFIVGIKTNTSTLPVYTNIMLGGYTLPTINEKDILANFINENTELICDEVVYVVNNNGDVVWEIEDNNIGDDDVIPI